MSRFAYCGLKRDGEAGLSQMTGIIWFAGDEHDVSDEAAQIMRNHADMWREVKPAAAQEVHEPADATAASPHDEEAGEAARTDAAAQTDQSEPVKPVEPAPALSGGKKARAPQKG